MTRAVPQEVSSIPDSDAAAAANASLRLLRWIQWGDGWQLSAENLESVDLDAMLTFDAESASRPVLSRLLAAHRARAQARAEHLRARGFVVQNLRMPTLAPLRLDAVPDASTGPALLFHRNLGLPHIPAVVMVRMLRATRMQASPASEAEVPPDDSQRRANTANYLYGNDIQPGAVIVFDALPVEVPCVAQYEPDPRWCQGPGSSLVMCITSGTELDLWIAGLRAQDVEQVLQDVRSMWTSLGFEPRPEPVPEPEVAQAIAEAAVAESEPGGPALPTEVPPDIPTVTVHVPTVQYLPNNGRVVVMFVPPGGRDAMKADEQLNSVAMSDELRSRLRKKKSLSQVSVEVEAVGNSWKIRGISAGQ